MTDRSIYDSARLAAAYAAARPPVHARIVEHIKARFDRIGIGGAQRALDVGCGAGVSTAALEPLADRVVGLEPVMTMLTHRRRVAPLARFVAGRAEQLPFASRAFDLIAAAGSLNYADLSLFLPEAARVLAARGTLVVYDFSSGRRLAADTRLDEWFTEFEQRYPFPAGYEMDVRRLDYARAGLQIDSCEELEISVPMSGHAYLEYVLSETNVEQALVAGIAEREIREWCREGTAPLFADALRDVLFDAYVAYISRH